MTTPKEFTQTIDKVILENLSFTDLEPGKNSKSKQAIAYPRYNFPGNNNYGNNSLFIQLPWIELTTYGIPNIGEYIKDDSQRLYIKVPLDIIKHADLINFLTKIDERFGNEKFKIEYLSKFIKTKNKEKIINKYTYIRIFKEPQEINDDSDKQRPPYIKIKFDTDYSTGDIKTILYDTEVEIDENSGEYTVISRSRCENIKTISDCAEKIKWKSVIRPVVRIVKMWCLDPNASNPTYGITLKVAKIDIMKSNIETKSIYKSYMNDDNTFIDDQPKAKTNKSSIKNEQLQTVTKVPHDDKSESSDNSDSNIELNKKSSLDGECSDGSDSEVELKPKSNTITKSKKPELKNKNKNKNTKSEIQEIESESESDSESDSEKPEISNHDSESETEIKPAKSAKTKGKK